MVQNRSWVLGFFYILSMGLRADPPCSATVDGLDGTFRASDGGTVEIHDPGIHVNNYTNFAPLNRSDYNAVAGLRDPARIRATLSQPEMKARLDAFFGSYYQTITDPAAARSLLAAIFNKPYLPATCETNMQTYLAQSWPAGKKPNLYIYVGGFGQHVQLNDTTIDAGEVVKWINERDPNALVVSLGWFCEAADVAGHGWCKDQSKQYLLPRDHPVVKNLIAKTQNLPRKDPFWKSLDAAGQGNNVAYNESLASVLEIGAHLIQIYLAADLGNVHLFGYSLGAHAVSELMIFDYPNAEAKRGFPWGLPGVCEDGGSTCHVSELKKVKWALGLGLPGWSQALRYAKNGLRYDNSAVGFTAPRPPDSADRLAFENGGLFSVPNATYRPFGATQDITLNYNGKFKAANHRDDPTSVSDDPYERGVNDALYHEYNHYGHDYNRPLLWSDSFKTLLGKYLEAPKPPADLRELGIIWGAGAAFDFEDCAEGGCNPLSLYAAHKKDKDHYELEPMRPVDSVRIVAVDGPVPGVKTNALAVEQSNDKPLQAYTMDQEDLRGSVELSWRPEFDLGDGQIHGIFSYGSCNGSTDELMPAAYVDGRGNLIFTMSYKGDAEVATTYTAKLTKAKLAALVKKNRWAHLSFNWDLPTTFFARNPTAADLSTYGDSLAIADGLFKNLRNTLRRQAGAGTMRIFVNGAPAQSANLGDANSARHCLTFAETIVDPGFDILSRTGLPLHYEGYNPYKDYGDASRDETPICKAYKIRNAKVFFGCAKSEAVAANASAQMDNVRIIFGAPRESFPEVNHADGSLIPWEKLAGIE